MEQAQWPRRPTSDIAVFRGHPLPLGATVQPNGINFAIASRYATAVTRLVLGVPLAGDAPVRQRWRGGGGHLLHRQRTLGGTYVRVA